jgi:two-component system chemotaxis sensor kinase CheA
MARGDPLQFELDDEDLKLFSEEADEQLESLDTALVQLEGEPDPDLVQQIFRAAHTLKGSSATIGHKRMAQLTHAMETVLDAVRQGKKQPTSDVVDALLAGLDALRDLAQEVITRVDSGAEIEHLERNLLDLLEEHASPDNRGTTAGGGAFQLSPRAIEAASSGIEAGSSATLLDLTIDPQCQLPSIRCYQALQEVEALGTVVETLPEREQIEAGAGEFKLVMVVVSAATEEELKAALADVSDVTRVESRALQVEELHMPLPVADISPEKPGPGEPRHQLTVVANDSPAETGNGADATRPARKSSGSIRIDVERLDGLMNLVGELVIDRTRLQQIREQLAGVLKESNLTDLTENFEETTNHLARVTDELQEEIMRSRMLPVRSVLTRLPRLVRDVAARCGKKVDLITAGEETELDRSVIEEISDPLVHVLRNAVDHGIETPEERRTAGKPETGTVTVTAWNQETYIYISVKDDGKGIDTGALRQKAIDRGLVSREAAEAASDEQVLEYIFYAGLSTAKVVSDVSGRGVGMDIVRTNIERLNGEIKLKSTRGKGSEVIIQLPLTLATTKALMVMSNGTVYAVPLVSVTEALPEHDADIHRAGGQKTLRLRDKLLPVVNLADALGDQRPRQVFEERYLVAAKHGDRQVAFVVDRILGEQDVVVKALGDIVGIKRGITGATILGDGSLGLIIDIASLVSEAAPLAATA